MGLDKNEFMTSKFPETINGSTITVGFTGTRAIEKISEKRLFELHKELLKIDVSNNEPIFVHGGAQGMDEYFHNIVINIVDSQVKVIFAKGMERELEGEYETLPSKPPLERNTDIVDMCDILIAVPIDPEVEEQRSGTWATIRYAKKMGKKIVMI